MTNWREAVERVGASAIVLGALFVALTVAYLVPDQPIVALGVATVVLVAVLALVNPVTLPLLAMPTVVIVARVGGGGVDLPLADVLMGIALWPALVMSPRPYSPALRRLLWLNLAYQGATLFAVIAHPFVANTVDWFHNWLLVSGALVIGWSVGRSGYGKLGMRLFLLVVLGIAAMGIAEGLSLYAQGDFRALYPSFPFPMHKNFFGTLMCFGALVLYARPEWLALPRAVVYGGFWVLVSALGVSQSRQAIVALAVGLFIIAVRGRSERRRGWLGLVLGIPALAVVATLVREQAESGNEHNSFFQRLEWYGDSIANWETAPWFGLGLRYWTEGRGVYNFHPPQVFLEVLATTGIVGLAGFVIMTLGMLRTLWVLPGVTGALALALVGARFVQGQLDIFWVSPTTAIPFLLAGVCLGVLAGDSVRHPTLEKAPIETRA